MKKSFCAYLFSLLIFLQVGCKSEETQILPTVSTTQAYTPREKSAIIGGTIINDFDWCASKGICYSRSSDPLIDLDPVKPQRGVYIETVDLRSLSFTLTLSDLESGVKYYAKAFTVGGWRMTNPETWHVVYGNEVTFTTK